MNTTHPNNELNHANFLSFEETIDLAKIAGYLYQKKWIILAISFCTFVMAFLYTMTLQPQYSTSALIRIDAKTNNVNIFENLGLQTNQASSAEMELALLQTRYILEPIIRAYHLNLQTMPHYFPIIGPWFAKRQAHTQLAKPFLGLRHYAWGGEQLQVKSFIVPRDQEGQLFYLIAGKQGKYQLLNNQHERILSGQVGEMARSIQAPGISFQVDHLRANPGTEFFLTLQSPLQMVGQVSGQLKVSRMTSETRAMQDTGIIQLQLSGSNSQQIERVLNAIVQYAVSKNAQLKAREAEKTLGFLSQRLPVVRQSVQRAENALNHYYLQRGTWSTTIENNLLMQELNTTVRTLEELRLQKTTLLQVYTPRYPLVIAVAEKESQLVDKLQAIKQQIRLLPIARQESANLERDVRIKNTLYETLLRNMYQMEVTKAGLVSDIIALDRASSPTLIPSNASTIWLMGTLSGLFLSVLILAAKVVFAKTIDNTDELENHFQTPIKAIVPFSSQQKQLDKMIKNKLYSSAQGTRLPILAQHAPKEAAVEGLHSLRISLHMTHSDTQHRVIGIASGLSGVGKSFIALNLAHVLAGSGKRTLVIDADIRRGRLHRFFTHKRQSGLSEYLAGESHLADSIHCMHDNLFYLTRGKHAQHPVELLRSSRLQELIQQASNEFDHIVIDMPPILPVIDAVLIAKYCDTKLLVVGGLIDQIDLVKQAIKKMRAHAIEIDGLVLNYLKPIARFGAKYTYYNYTYRS